VKIMTLAEGEISELHVGLKGTMNALFLKDLAKKTHRGIRGRVEKGKAGGGLCYGYDVVKRLDTEGEPVCGERTINQAEAAVVRRVFRDFGNGISPRTIAQRLNADRIPGPGGKLWSPTTLRGHAKRGTGFLNNALYVGKLVWNRQRYVKDPSTGKRVSRINPESAWITTDVPELRIVDDALWREAKARQDSISIQYAAAIAGLRSANRLNRTHRPKSLLSGLLFCGCCGGSFSLRGQGRFACSTHIDNNSCSNSRTISRDLIEARVLDGLRDKLMAPEIAAEAVRAYVEETNRLNHQRRAVGAADKTELAKIVKAIDGLVEIAMEGRGTRALTDKLLALEARKDAIRARIAEVPIDVPDIHPNIAEIYRRKVERLSEALNQPAERDEAADAIRGLIERVTLTPGPKRGALDATLHGEFGAILDWVAAHEVKESRRDKTPSAGALGVLSVSLVAGTGFEPVTFRL
jgi:site-specific DNA recombinase